MDGLKARLSFDAVAYDYDDEYLTIDTDTHTININNVSRLFGVQYDGNSKLIKFRIRNKLSDIQKMQDSIVYINWIDSRGVKGQSIAINKTINNDTCEFAWKVPFDALKNSGVLHFAMSAVVTKNSSSVIDQRWSTQIASVITPDGIYIKSYTPSSEEEDRIAQIYNELSKMINKQNDNLQSQVSSLKEDLVHVNSNVKFNPVWGANIYVGDELNLAKERIDKARALSMSEVMICVNFQDDENKDFYHAYKYTETYSNINKILDYAHSVGIKVTAIKIHISQELSYSSMNFEKYTKGLSALHGYISGSSHRPEYMFVLNENTLTDSSTNDGLIVGLINTVQNLGYKCGMSMFGSYQYVSKTSPNILNRLDVIGINYYEVISPKDADTTVSDSISAWTNANVNSHITNIKHYAKKPVWITETGMFDNSEAFYFPADSWTWGLEKGDGEAESIYFEGCFHHLKISDADKVFGWDIDSMYSDKMIALCRKYIL